MGIVFWPPAVSVEILRTTRQGTFTLNIHTDGLPVIVDWGDGTAKETIPGTGPVTHNYLNAGEKAILVGGEFRKVTNIAMGNQDLTSVTLKSLTQVQGSLSFNSNPGLSRLELPETTAVFTVISLHGCNLSGVVDFRPIPHIGGSFQLTTNSAANTGNAGVTGMLFDPQTVLPPAFTHFYCVAAALTGTLDLRNLKNLGGDVRLNNNPNLTGLLLPVSSVPFSLLSLSSCNLSGVLDTSTVAATGTFTAFGNPNLTGVLVNAASTYASSFLVYSAGLASLDLSASNINTSNFRVYSNPNLAQIRFGANNSFTGVFYAYLCKLDQAFPLGTAIRGTDIRIYSNGMSEANVNATIDNLYQNRAAFPTSAKTLHIHGTNAAPTGTALTQIADLRANYNWTITHT